MARDAPDYDHGSTGTQPSTAQDFQSGDYPDPEHFDYFIYQLFATVQGFAAEFDRLDADDDGIVDEADYAADADASTYKGQDIDSDGDGVVDRADVTDGVQTRTSDPSRPSDGDVWLRTDL